MLGPDARFPRPFGDHLLLRRLAAGGMAEVFEARASGPGGFEKRVALKRLLPEHQGDAELVRALVREARLGAMLSHPNLCRVDALGAVDGVWFFTLELVDGLDLYRLHRRFRRHDLAFPIELALHVVAGVARGLHHAHDARNAQGRALRVVHRDVSPQNVLVGRDGRVKVVDFGIARTGLHRTRTARGIVKGKWAYMSPEQARGARLDRRSDVYATGVLLYELVCGRLPPAPGCGGRNGSGGPRSRDGCSGPAGHRSRQLPWSRAAPAAPPAPPPARPGLPRELLGILRRALEPDPKDRYPTAGALGDAVEECLHRRFPRFTVGRAADIVEAVAAELVTGDASSGEPPRGTPATPADRPRPGARDPGRALRPAWGRTSTPTESMTPAPLLGREDAAGAGPAPPQAAAALPGRLLPRPPGGPGGDGRRPPPPGRGRKLAAPGADQACPSDQDPGAPDTDATLVVDTGLLRQLRDLPAP